MQSTSVSLRTSQQKRPTAAIFRTSTGSQPGFPLRPESYRSAPLQLLAVFQAPSDGSNLGILPFALDQHTWDELMNGTGTDDYSYNADTGGVDDGERRNQGGESLSPGNRARRETAAPWISAAAINSTADISRQITSGINASDLKPYGR